jgi:hypothetical protein
VLSSLEVIANDRCFRIAGRAAGASGVVDAAGSKTRTRRTAQKA